MRTDPAPDRNEILILGILHVGLIMGVVIFCGVVLLINQVNGGNRVADIPEAFRILTGVATGLSVAALAVSGRVFRHVLESALARTGGGLAPKILNPALRSAYLVKAALMEAPALLGLAVLLLIVVLPCDLWRAPAFYRFNFLPAAVFLLEAALRFPTPGRVDFILRSMSPDGHRPGTWNG